MIDMNDGKDFVFSPDFYKWLQLSVDHMLASQEPPNEFANLFLHYTGVSCP